MADALVAGRGKIVAPGEVEDLGAVLGGDFFRGVGRAGIDDDRFIDQIDDRPEARRQAMCFVLGDQAEGDALGM